MSHVTKLCCVLAVLLLAPAVAGAEDLVDNPAYVSWAKHKPGTTRDTEMTMNVAGQAMTVKMAQELISVDPDHVVVETNTNMAVPGVPAGKGDKRKLKIPAKVSPKQVDMPEGSTGTVKQVGEEEVELLGKRYACRVVEFSGESQGMKSTGKIWNSADMPGATVKMDMTSESPSGPAAMTMRVVAVNTK